MKNRTIFVLATAIVLLFAACHKDKNSINMNANIVAYGNNNSKVYVDNNHYANWNDGDKVMINGVNYTVGVSGNIASISGVAVNENGYYAIYPSDRATVSGDGYPSILMPQVQIYKPSASGKQLINAPMAAYCPSRDNGTHSLNFVNLCSLIEVNVPTNTEVAYITVTSTNNFLWGKATITGGGNPVLSIDNEATASAYTTANKTVTLDCTTNGSNGSDNSGGSDAATGVTSADPFYIVVPARTYTDLTVDVYVFETNTNGRRMVKLFTKSANASNNSATVESNMIYAVTYSGEPTPVQPPYPGLGTGEFSVSSTKKVRFSQGNLQYRNGAWRFSDDELVAFRNASDHNLETTNRSQYWIDLFGFGASGQGNLSTLPTTYTNTSSSYPQESLTATNRYDWGVNEISNGGNQPDKWRTLTKAEWQYLLGTSSSRNNKNRRAVIDCGNNTFITGLIIAPDGSTVASGWNSVTDYALRISRQVYVDNYQSVGCVFLPVTGYYAQNNSGDLTMQEYSNTPTGWYWTSTYDGQPWAAKVICDPNGMGISFAGQGIEVSRGCAVRLVRDVD